MDVIEAGWRSLRRLADLLETAEPLAASTRSLIAEYLRAYAGSDSFVGINFPGSPGRNLSSRDPDIAINHAIHNRLESKASAAAAVVKGWEGKSPRNAYTAHGEAAERRLDELVDRLAKGTINDLGRALPIDKNGKPYNERMALKELSTQIRAWHESRGRHKSP
jgi:hypothetical protein